MLVKIQKHILSRPFTAQNGHIIENGVVIYEEYGNKDGEVIVIAHGGLSNQHAAGKYTKEDTLEGWWSNLIGENKIFDTNKYRIICANALGGLAGTTAPSNYDKTFPEITMIDQANYQKQFLEEINVKEVFIMAGVSMGSLLTLQMSVLFPNYIKNIIPIATSPYMTPGGLLAHNFLINILKSSNNKGDSLSLFNQFGKLYYTSYHLCNDICSKIDNQADKNNAIKAYLTGGVTEKSKSQNADDIITTLNAINTFNISNGFTNLKEAAKNIKANCLIINIDNDIEFPPMFAIELEELIKDNGNHVELKIITSVYGHVGCVVEQKQIGDCILEFLQKI